MHSQKGFIGLGIALAITAAISFVSSVWYIKSEQQKVESYLGTVISTALTDTIGTFRTNVNTSLTNLQNELGSVSTTIATYGTIATENTPLVMNKGGTSTTTVPSANTQFLGSQGTAWAVKTFIDGSGVTVSST